MPGSFTAFARLKSTVKTVCPNSVTAFLAFSIKTDFTYVGQNQFKQSFKLVIKNRSIHTAQSVSVNKKISCIKRRIIIGSNTLYHQVS